MPNRRPSVAPRNRLEEISIEFFDAWSQSDPELLISYFATDAIYHNVPLQPLTGTVEIKSFLDGYFSVVHLDIITDVIATVGNTVLSERLDILTLEGREPVDLPVMGTMEFNEEGKIVAWRDYFDLGTAERGTGLKF